MIRLSGEKLGELKLLLLAMIWGGSFVAAKFSMDSFDAYWLMVMRFFIGALSIWLLFSRERKKINRSTLKGGAEVGLLMGIGTAFQMVGLNYTTPANQTFIIVSYVIMVPLINFAVSGKRPGRHIFIAAGCTIIGVGFLTLGPNLSFNIGDGMTLIMALLFAIQIIRIDRWMLSIDSAMMFTAVQLFVAGIVSVVLFLFQGAAVIIAPITSAAVLGFIYMVFLNTAVAFALQNDAQRQVSPEKSALILSSESLFGTLAAVLFTGEVFYGKKVIGCILIFLGQCIAQVLPILHLKAREKRERSV